MSEYICDNIAYQEACDMMDNGTYISATVFVHTVYVVILRKGDEDLDVLADDCEDYQEAYRLKKNYLSQHPKANVFIDSYEYESDYNM